MTTNPDHSGLADLVTIAVTVEPTLLPRSHAAKEAAIEANADLNRIALAQILLDAEIPENAHVDLMDWADEPNEDGTYDMDVNEAYLPATNEVIDSIGGSGAVPAGRLGGGTDWDIFMIDIAPKYGMRHIEVAKVYAWLRAQGAQNA
jgi:hypothetical protein